MYLDYGENKVKRKIPMTMEDWENKLNAFLQFKEYELLNNSGKVTAEIAKAFAESEFQKYRIVQDRLFESDFDKLLKESGESDKLSEIHNKHSKYINSAIARAKFLITNTNNAEGKISRILAYLSDEFNKDKTLNLYDEVDDSVFQVFNIFPQGFIDSDSLYVVPISKKVALPEELNVQLGMSEEEREMGS